MFACSILLSVRNREQIYSNFKNLGSHKYMNNVFKINNNKNPIHMSGARSDIKCLLYIQWRNKSSLIPKVEMTMGKADVREFCQGDW